MKYNVPLFIEREARIIPGLTFKQLVYLMIFGVLGILLWARLPGFLKYIFAPPFFLVGISLAFVKIEGLSAVKVVGFILEYLTGGRIFIWKKEKERLKYEEEKKPFPLIKVAKREEEKKFLKERESLISGAKLKLEMKTK